MRDNYRSYIGVLSIFAFFALPVVVSAAGLKVSEIMYDPLGSNAGHQWIQIANTGSEAIDIAGYKLFQNGINHGIFVIVGTTTLAVGEIGIIASNPVQFLADYPNYTGTLFKSSYTLRVVGDTIVLKDSKQNVVDSAVYSSVNGASGDGNALYWYAGKWVPGAPDPGSYHVSPPSAIVAKVLAAQLPAVKILKSSDKKTATKTLSDTRPSNATVETEVVATPSDGEREGVAAVASSGSNSLWLMEMATGFAAVVVVIVASVLLSTRFVPQPTPVTEQSPEQSESFAKKNRSEALGHRPMGEADEYDLVDSPDIFLR